MQVEVYPYYCAKSTFCSWMGRMAPIKFIIRELIYGTWLGSLGKVTEIKLFIRTERCSGFRKKKDVEEKTE
jgi:hypothetical protein